MAIFIEAAQGTSFQDDQKEFADRSKVSKRKLTLDEVVAEIRKLGLPRRDEATQMIREDRDR